MFVRRRRIFAEDEVDTNQNSVDVAPEATELLFETDDVAQLVAEVSGDPVEVATNDETGEVTFTVGEDEYTVTPDEDAEILESSRRVLRGKRPVRASATRRTPVVRRTNSRRPASVRASRQPRRTSATRSSSMRRLPRK